MQSVVFTNDLSQILFSKFENSVAFELIIIDMIGT